MNFTAYIQRQKSAIRARHEGETYLICPDEIIVLRSTEEILKELDGMKGLNGRQREGSVNRKRSFSFA